MIFVNKLTNFCAELVGVIDRTLQGVLNYLSTLSIIVGILQQLYKTKTRTLISRVIRFPHKTAEMCFGKNQNMKAKFLTSFQLIPSVVNDFQHRKFDNVCISSETCFH